MASETQEAASFRLRVANLAWETEDESFKNFFKEYNPTEAVIIRRKRTNRSRGYGFVNFENENDMNKALETLNGSQLDNREIKIAVSTSKGPYPEGSTRPGRQPREGRRNKSQSESPSANGAADDNTSPEDTPEPSAARLIVQRLGWEVDDDKLKEAFGKYGEVTSAKVIKNRRSQRSRGYGFVTFANEADGAKALEELDGNEDLGFEQKEDGAENVPVGIKVLQATSSGPRKRPARQRKRKPRNNDDDKSQDRPGPRRLFVRNLKEETGEDALRAAFEAYGAIKNVRVVMDRNEDPENPKSKGIAFVTYEEHDSFKKALEAFENGGEVDGAEVEVKRALPSRFIRNRNRGGGRGRGRGGRGGGNSGGTAL